MNLYANLHRIPAMKLRGAAAIAAQTAGAQGGRLSGAAADRHRLRHSARWRPWTICGRAPPDGGGLDFFFDTHGFGNILRQQARRIASRLTRKTGSKTMAQKDIQSVLQEDRVFPPSAAFRKQATLKARRTSGHVRQGRGRLCRLLGGPGASAKSNGSGPSPCRWTTAQAPNYRWFTDGQLNVSHNCLDVHLRERGDKTAIIFEGEPGDVRKLTYAELHARCAGSPTRSRRAASGAAIAWSFTCR